MEFFAILCRLQKIYLDDMLLASSVSGKEFVEKEETGVSSLRTTVHKTLIVEDCSQHVLGTWEGLVFPTAGHACELHTSNKKRWREKRCYKAICNCLGRFYSVAVNEGRVW